MASDGEPTPPASSGQPTGSPLPSFSPEWLTQFKRRIQEPPEAQVVGTEQREGYRVEDITYPGVQRSVEAYRLVPDRRGPMAAVLYLHWLGSPDGNRTEFLEEAGVLAGEGVASIHVQGWFPWRQEPSDSQTDHRAVLDEVEDLRRALDLLVEIPGVDPDRVAVVGHDFGAMYGALLCVVDDRPSGCVFLQGTARWSDWLARYWSGPSDEGLDRYAANMADLDPIAYLQGSDSISWLFQFSEDDTFVPVVVAEAIADAAPEPKQLEFYSGAHRLTGGDDRIQWLRENVLD